MSQELFDYLYNELGVTALNSQMGDIEIIVLGKEEYIRRQNEMPVTDDKRLLFTKNASQQGEQC